MDLPFLKISGDLSNMDLPFLKRSGDLSNMDLSFLKMSGDLSSMDLSFLKMSGDLLGRLLPKRKRRGKSATLRRRTNDRAKTTRCGNARENFSRKKPCKAADLTCNCLSTVDQKKL